MNFSQMSLDYERIAIAIRYLEAHVERQPSLTDVAAAAHMSEYHFQRLFSRWVGISPKRFLQFLTKEHAKAHLGASHSVLEATFESGLSSPGRLHDLFVQCEAVTPGEFKRQGEGLEIRYGIHPTPFGEALIAVSGRGITNLFFLNGADSKAPEQLQRSWPRATLCCDTETTGIYIRQVFDWKHSNPEQPLHILLKGTNFQIKVWEALMRIPSGKIVAYEDIARAVGMPQATRAVAGAIARNPVAYVIPCHRVIRKTGVMGGYRWGSERKKALLFREYARATG